MNRVQGPAMELNQGQRQETSHLQHRSDVHPGDRHTYTTAQASGQKWRRAPWGRGRGFQVRLIKATKANWCSQNPDTSHNEAIVICITSPSLLQPYYKKKKNQSQGYTTASSIKNILYKSDSRKSYLMLYFFFLPWKPPKRLLSVLVLYVFKHWTSFLIFPWIKYYYLAFTGISVKLYVAGPVQV